MASYADTLLAVDMVKEQSEEKKAIDEYVDRLKRDAASKQEKSLWGGLIGGLLGAGFGGPMGMAAGWKAGSAGGQWYGEYSGLEPYNDPYRTLGKEVYEGGKFHKQDMRDWVDESVQLQEDQKWDEMMGTAIDAIGLAYNISSYGGFDDYSDMTFGQGLQSTWQSVFDVKGLDIPEGFGTEAEYISHINEQIKGGATLKDIVSPANLRRLAGGQGGQILTGILGEITQNLGNK